MSQGYAPQQPKNSVFDNSWTILYKTAQLNGLASPQLFRTSAPGVPANQVTYYPVLNQIVEGYNSGWSLWQIYEYMLGKDGDLDLKVFVEEFMRYINQTDAPRDWIINEIDVLSKYLLFLGRTLDLWLTNFDQTFALPRSMADDFESVKKQEQKIFTDIIEIQAKYEQIMRQPKLHRSDIEETSIIYEISDITWLEQKPMPEMGDLLFISIECSLHVPCVIYVNDKGEQKYKVYRGKELEREPPYDIIIPRPTKIHNNIIYMNLWLGDPTGANPDAIYKPSKESFRLVTYNLEKNNLVASIPLMVRGEDRHTNESLFRSRISKAMAEFNLGQFIQVKQVAEVKILPDTRFFPESRIDDSTFLHVMLNNKLFYNCLHIEEVTNPFPLKSKMHIRYRPAFSDINRSRESTFALYISNPTTISFSLKRIVVDEMETVQLHGGVETVLPAGYIYYQVGISQSESLEEIESFLTTFMAILSIYLSSDPMTQLPYIENIFRADFFSQDDTGVANIMSHFRKAIIERRNFLSPDDMRNIFNERFKFPFDNLPDEIKAAFLAAFTDVAAEREIYNMYNFYRYVVPRLARLPSKTEPVPGTEERVSERKIFQLGRQFPDVFVPGYASLGSEIPEVIPLTDLLADEKKRAIEAETFISRGGHFNRTVLSFPREEAKFLFYCPSTDHPFPGVRENTLTNKDKFAFVPICFAEDQMRKDSNTRRYYQGNKEDMVKGAQAIKYRPIVGNGKSLPNLSPTLRDVFSLRQNNELTEMKRMGVVSPNESDPNALLHCVLTAVGDPNYISRTDIDQRRDYVQKIRQKLASSIHVGLLKQELYDVADARILAELADINKFLDPRLYYRVLEELYNINIFVFVQSRDDVDSIEIPRHRYMHIRPNRSGRHSVVVIKYFSTRGFSKNNFPHCELIVEVERANENNRILLFKPESDISKICYDTLTRSMKDTTWMFKDRFDIYLNMYNQVNYYVILGITFNERTKKTNSPIVAQYIDEYGKARALVIAVTLGAASHNMTLVIPPTQPFDAPTVKPDTFPLVHYSVVTAILGENNLTGVYQNDSCIVGLWFRTVDIRYHTYVPIVPTTTQLTSKITHQPIPAGPLPPINAKTHCGNFTAERATTPTASSFVQAPQIEIGKVGVSIARIIQLQKMLSITLQLMQWVFNIERFLAGTDFPGQINLFLEKSFSEELVRGEYNYTDLGPRLPQINFSDDALVTPYMQAMTHIGEKCNLVRYDKFVFPDDVTRTKFMNEMRRYARYNFDADVTIARNIRNYYSSYEDFTTSYDRSVGVEIFIGERELSLWLKYRNIMDKPVTILQKLTSTLAYEEEPIVYEDDDGKIYIIQNVSTGEFSQAIDVVTKWMLKKQNRGYNYISKKRVAEDKNRRKMGQVPSVSLHKIFAISVSGHFEVVEDKSSGQPNFMSILTYSKVPPGFVPVDRYAAILQLL